MIILSIIMFFVGIISFIVSFILAGLKLETAAIIFLIPSLCSPLLSCLVFYRTTNKYPLNNLSEYHIENFEDLFVKENDVYVIKFIKENRVWVCANEAKKVKLNLGTYLFQKSYIISYVIRNVRFPLVSGIRPLKSFLENKFLIRERIDLKLVLINGKKKYEKLIIKKGISEYGYLAREITYSPFYLKGLTHNSLRILLKTTIEIDEEKYKNFNLKNKKLQN